MQKMKKGILTLGAIMAIALLFGATASTASAAAPALPSLCQNLSSAVPTIEDSGNNVMVVFQLLGSHDCSIAVYQNGQLVSSAIVTTTHDGSEVNVHSAQVNTNLQYGKIYGSDMSYGCNWSGCYISFTPYEIDSLQAAITIGGLGTPAVFNWLSSEFGWFTAEILSALGIVGAIVTVFSTVVIWICDDYYQPARGVYFAIGGQGIVMWCNPVGSGGY